MPKLRYHHARRGPRENDYGFLFALCRDEGLYVQRPEQRGGPYVITERHAAIFTGSIVECVRYVRERLGEVAQ